MQHRDFVIHKQLSVDSASCIANLQCEDYLSNLPDDVLVIICDEIVMTVGIRNAFRLRTICRRVDHALQRAILGLLSSHGDGAWDKQLFPGPGISDDQVANFVKATLARPDSDKISLTRHIKEGVATACLLLDRDDDDIKEKCVSALVYAAVRAVSFMTIARHLNKTTRCACSLCTGSSALWSALICLSEVDSDFVDDLLRNKYRPRLTRTAFFGDLISSAAGSGNFDLLDQVATFWEGYPEHLQVDMRGVRLANALLLAESKDDFDAISLLLSRQPSIVNSDIYLLAITQAFQHNHAGIACRLVREQQFMKWKQRSRRHRFLLRAASQIPNEWPLRLMLDHPDAAGLNARLNAPLEDACRLGRLNSVRLLLSQASPASLTEYSGATYWAARSGSVEILRLLSTETDCRSRPRADSTALVGASFDKTETLNYIICQWLGLESALFPEMGSSAYVKACEIFSCKFNIVRQMSCICSPPDMHDPLREDETKLVIRQTATPMPALGSDSSIVHVTTRKCSTSCLSMHAYWEIWGLWCEHCRIFLDLGWNIDASFEGHSAGTGSPLFSVVEDLHLTSWFLEQGADPNGQGSFTPLMAAAEFGTLPCLRLLVDYGGDLERANLLHFAAVRDDLGGLEITDWLLSQHVNVNTQLCAANPFSPESELDPKAIIETPLHAAVRCGSYATAALLLEHKADPSLRDSEGMTPLDCLKQREDAEGVTDSSRLLFQGLTKRSGT